MVRRGKTTYFVDAFENTKVVELKKMLECLTRQLSADMRLLRENEAHALNNNYGDVSCRIDRIVSKGGGGGRQCISLVAIYRKCAQREKATF